MKKVEYYYTDGVDKVHFTANWLPSIIMVENGKVITFWCYEGRWLKHDGKSPDLNDFRPMPKRISKRKAEELMFLEGL